MPRSQLIGFTTCPECDYPDAEVRLDKNGHPYRVCFQCAPPTQYFTRGAPDKVKRLTDKMRPVNPSTAPAAAPASAASSPAPAPAPAGAPTAPPAAPARRGPYDGIYSGGKK